MPQGSIFERVLFLWYRNDLLLNTQVAKMVLLPDDTNILVIGKDLNVLQPKWNRVMKQLEIRFQNNNLLVNTKKIMAMLFQSNKISPLVRIHVVFNNSKTAYTSKLIFLGIKFTEN